MDTGNQLHTNVTTKTLLACTILGMCLASHVNATTGVSDSEILIGSSLPLEGSFSVVGTEAKQGLDAYFSAINTAGGVNGRQIKLIAYNDSYDPVECVKNTMKLIDEDKVFALCNYVGTPTSVKAMKVWQGKQVPVVGFYTGTGTLRKPFSPYNIHVRASYAKEAEAIVDAFVNKAGAKKIAIFYQNDAFGEAVKTATEDALQKLGITPVAYGSYERSTVDIDKGLEAVKAASPDAIIMAGTYAPLSKFVKAAKSAGLNNTLFHTVSFVGPEALAKELGSDSGNVFVTQVMPPYTDSSISIAAEYVSALKKFAPDAAPSFPGFEAYANAKVLVEGLKRAGKDLTVDGFIKGIDSISSGKESIGLNLSYSAENHEGLNEVFITQIKNGSYEIVTDWAAYKH
jgi:ABC-type branched-subunit amino acid transport system substrate-binding protein